MPLPSRAELLDIILAARLRRFLDGALPQSAAVWEGARPKTQMLDITHGLSLVVEKAIDEGSAGALSQCDAATYYDCLDVVDCLKWMVRHGLDIATAAAAAKSQLLPRLCIKCGDAVVQVHRRACGALTGSRVAGQCGRVPIVTSMVAATRSSEVSGWHMGADEWTFSSFVDNVYSQAASMHQAMKNCEVFEECLWQQWRLRVKPSSFLVMPVRGAEVSALRGTWRQVASFKALGILIDDDGGMRSDMKACEDAMRKSLFRNCVGKAIRALPVATQQRHVDRMLRPLMSLRASRWPVSANTSAVTDRWQKKLLRTATVVERRAGDSNEEYFRRRGLAGAAAARRHGLWSEQHRARVRAWRDHLERPLNSSSPAARLLRWHGRAWRRERRLAAGFVSGEAGRLGSRVLTHVWTRWDESW